MNIIKKIQNISPTTPKSPQQCLHQQKIAQQSQQVLIKAIKQQLVRLQQENQQLRQENRQLTKQLEKQRAQSSVLSEKVSFLKQNNESLLHTFQVFQNEFIKRNKRESLGVYNSNVMGSQSQGPFHLQIVRTVKSKIINTFIEPVKAQEASQFMPLYNYFFQENSVQQEQVQLFNQLVQQGRKVRSSKIRSLGKRNYFNERFRHVFWFNSIQNRLKLTPKHYSLLQSTLNDNAQNRPPKTSIIDLDIRRMDFRIQQSKTAQLKTQLKKLLEIFQLYRPDIGYVQGMSYFGWMFLVRMNPMNSWIAFANVLLTDPFVSGLYVFDQDKIRRIKVFFEEAMADKRPKLWKYTQQLGVDSELFIIEWAYTFFSRAFTLKIVSKIWDLWFSQGYNVFFKVALAVFQMLQPELLQVIESDKYIDVLRNSTYKLDQNEFLKILAKQRLTEELKLE